MKDKDKTIKLESSGRLIGILYYNKIEYGQNNYGYMFINVYYCGNCIYSFVATDGYRIDYDNRLNFINIIM